MPGETDLGVLLSSLHVERRLGTFTIVSTSESVTLTDGVGALVHEAEGSSVACTIEYARARGWSVDFEAAWLTLAVHSSLEAVGLTAAVAAALAEQGIPANVVAGFHHDHLLVPADRADDAVACLAALAARNRAAAL